MFFFLQLVTVYYIFFNPMMCRKNSKGDKELIMKEALSNAKLWEARYVAAEKSRQEYRENAKALLSNNEMLQSAVDQVLYVVLFSLFW